MKAHIKPIVQISVMAMAALTFVSCQSTGSTAGGVKPYTKEVCIVSGNTLGSMGDPVTLINDGQEVKFCCQPCVVKFKANPQKYLSQL